MRPLADRFEVRFPGVAAVAVRLMSHAPATMRRRLLTDAFKRAEDAFNRVDFATVFALFDEQVEYTPPPPLHDVHPIVGREAVERFWQEIRERFNENRITNLSIEETAPSRFVRTARLAHRGPGPELAYTIRQTTELDRGRVVRQVNEMFSA